MQPKSPLRAVVTSIVLFVLCALLVRYASQPPTPLPATAPTTDFSAERALTHVREIAQRPHPTGSADNVRVREYVVSQLRALGLDPQVQEATGVGTRYSEAGRVRNVMARLPGRTPGGLAVVLLAHYDGVAGGPAAGDDAAGTAAILETLRALRAGPPLAHDVMAVITDGEEAGLLGAAAFVREHPWAKDVGVTLNFEARGTQGRSYMFETGPGNLDVARVLRRAGDVSATSLSVTVYRSLPNDTDLSEMAILGKPALNFAFADGVERYHTAHDDVAHLDLGSLQHHGSQMLTLARAFGDGSLPRPATSDAVFFDVPLAGLIVYPQSWALPIALVALVLVAAAVRRLVAHEPKWGRDLALGIAGTLVSTVLAGGLVMVVGNAIPRLHDSMGWNGAPAFRGIYTAALALLAFAIAMATWALVRRWATAAGAHVGALVAWSVITLAITLKLPGVSFMFVWPLIAAAIAQPVGAKASASVDLTRGIRSAAGIWTATLIALTIFVPIVYAVSAVMLGAAGPGAIATGALVALLGWLLAPQMETLGSSGRAGAAAVTLVAAVAVACTGFATVRSSPDHPIPSMRAYALDADDTTAWVLTRGMRGPGVSNASASTTPPEWLVRTFGSTASANYFSAARLGYEPPSATILSDSTASGERTLTVRVRVPAGTEVLNMRAIDGRVVRAAVDGRAIDTTRYRSPVRVWRLSYSAPPADGLTLALTVPAGTGISLDLMARLAGMPEVPGLQLAPRAANVVTAQTGDITVVRRVVQIRK